MMQPPRDTTDPLTAFPIVITVPVAWGDMDAAKVPLPEPVRHRMGEVARRDRANGER
jgi:hypothetical protein